MSSASAEDIREFVRSFVTDRYKGQKRSASSLSDDCDLLLIGVLDSLGIIELITAAADHFGLAIDLDELDPEKMTIVGSLCRYLAQKTTHQWSGSR